MARSRIKKMKVHITIRDLGHTPIGRQFRACARMLKAGMGGGIGGSARHGVKCEQAPSPRMAVRGALRKVVDNLGMNSRPGHRRYRGVK